VLAVALAGLIAGCLREPPTAGGKRCRPDAGECGHGFTCVTRAVDGTPLDLSDAGVCQTDADDCPPATTTCPQEAPQYVCAPRFDSDAGCFEGGSERLAGSVCMVGKGQCRVYGVYQWNDVDGGSCLTEPDALRPTPRSECTDDAGPDPLCLCDGLDQNCDGVSDNFVGAFSSYLSATFKLVGTAPGCAAPDTSYQVLLGPDTSTTQEIDGSSVGPCAQIVLAHRFSLERLELTLGNVNDGGGCGVSGAGMPDAVALFHQGADGGYFGLGADGGASFEVRDGGAGLPRSLEIPWSGRTERLLMCLPDDATQPLGVTGFGVVRDLSAGHCDLP